MVQAAPWNPMRQPRFTRRTVSTSRQRALRDFGVTRRIPNDGSSSARQYFSAAATVQRARQIFTARCASRAPTSPSSPLSVSSFGSPAYQSEIASRVTVFGSYAPNAGLISFQPRSQSSRVRSSLRSPLSGAAKALESLAERALGATPREALILPAP